jgi:arylsulfatase
MKTIAYPIVIAMLIAARQYTANAAGNLDRSVLPIHEPQPPTITTLDARDAKAPPRFEVTAPDGAPNVVIVLIDDIGFGHSSAFGGPINMPTLERLANRGLKYNRFHTTALCSPTRVALLTGHNHHANNAGAIMEMATAFPGNTGVRPRSITTLAEILRQNGYSTGVRQIPRDAPVGSVGVRALRSLANRLGLRQVLRIHRRRDEPVGAGHLRWRDSNGDAHVARLSLHNRHD